MLRLTDAHRAALLFEPESGMGYQYVDATLQDDQTRPGIAYNAELLLFEGEPRSSLNEDYDALLKKARSAAGEVKTLRVVARSRQTGPPQFVKEATATTLPAKDAPEEETGGENDLFKRFSAFANDRRVNANGSLQPGTYATTAADAAYVKTGVQAVARYALPNPAPASFRFTIAPHKGTVIQRGIVQPAFGQPGGGVGVIFTRGTQPKTVTGPDKIPDR